MTGKKIEYEEGDWRGWRKKKITPFKKRLQENEAILRTFSPLDPGMKNEFEDVNQNNCLLPGL